MADTYPAIAYAKLDASEKKTQKSVDDDVEKGVIVMVHTPENLALIHGCSAWACCLLLVQIGASFVLWLATPQYLASAANFLFVIIGLIGVKSQRSAFLITHFIYSLLCLFFLVVVFSIGVFYCSSCGYSLLSLAAVILLVSFLLRKQRILIQALNAPRVPLIIDIDSPKEASKEDAAAPFDHASAPAPAAVPIEQMPSIPTVVPMAPEQQQFPISVQTPQGEQQQLVYMMPVPPYGMPPMDGSTMVPMPMMPNPVYMHAPMMATMSASGAGFYPSVQPPQFVPMALPTTELTKAEDTKTHF